MLNAYYSVTGNSGNFSLEVLWQMVAECRQKYILAKALRITGSKVNPRKPKVTAALLSPVSKSRKKWIS
jgi:hypothetical protein